MPYEPLHLDWPGLSNARDLGGLPAEGGRIRERALIRTESLTRLDEGGIDEVRAAGVSRVLDLRRPGESPDLHPFADDDATYVNVPVEDPADPKANVSTMLEQYLEMLDVRPDLFAAALAAIAEAPPGAVVVHCAAGKDRTGLVVGLALSVAGVSPEDVAADYAITEVRFAEHFKAYLDTLPAEQREQARLMQATPAENLQTVLEHLDQEYGGVEAYLRRGGMTDAQLDALRDRLVEAG